MDPEPLQAETLSISPENGDGEEFRVTSPSGTVVTLSCSNSSLVDDASNLCDFDIDVIRKHCMCKDCNDFFRTQQDLLSLFKEADCLGCSVRRRHLDVSSLPETVATSIAEGQDEINDEHLFCYFGKRNGNRHYMQDAKILPCLHHFCQECLYQEARRQQRNYKGVHDDNIDSDDDDDDDDDDNRAIAFSCPECSDNKTCGTAAEVMIKKNGEVTYDQLESSSLKHIVDTYVFEKRLIDGEELCDQCFEDNRQKAIAECVSEGNEMVPLCNECLRRHKSGRVTKEHKVILAEDLQMSPLVDRFSHYKAPFCKLHETSRICMYCPCHMTVVCLKCSVEEGHQRCEGKLDVDAHFNGHLRPYRDRFEELKEETKLLSKSINPAVETIEWKIKAISERCDKIVTEINDRSNRLKSDIEHQRKRLVNQTRHISRLKTEDFNDQLQHLLTIKTDIDHSIRWIQNFQNTATPINFFLFNRRMQDKMKSFNRYRDKVQEDKELMNTLIWHKTDSINRLSNEFQPFCTSFLGVIYSTPYLRNFSILPSHRLTLVCRDIFGTKLCKCLPDIEAKLLITEFTEVPSNYNLVNTEIECTVVKDEEKGIYNFKTNMESYYAGIYCLLISYVKPSAIFLLEKNGKTYRLRYTTGTGFGMID